MSAAPFFPLYLKDWVLDTRGFSYEDKGVLVDLLCLAWDRGSLPLDVEAIRRLTSCTPGAWQRVWATIQVNWIERDGGLIFPKLEAARGNMERRSQTAKVKAEKRWRDAAAAVQASDAAALLEPCCVPALSNAKQEYRYKIQEQPPESPPLALTRSLRPETALQAERFETFWAAYPRKTNRKSALRAFVARRPDHVLLAAWLDAIERQKQGRQWREGVIPHAATWLRGERWLDEPEAAVLVADGALVPTPGWVEPWRRPAAEVLNVRRQ